MSEPRASLLGHTDHDFETHINERTRLRAAVAERGRLVRGQFVTIADSVTPGLTFLGRLVAGPFFPDSGSIVAEIEIHGELHGLHSRATNNRPSPGSPVYELPPTEVAGLIGVGGDMVLGCLAGREDVPIRLRGDNKEVLPRNVGIFGTVGSGKSNSVQVLIEEAAAAGWAIVLLDLEGEYVDMDQPTDQEAMFPLLERHGRKPNGLADFHVYHPVSSPSSRSDSQAFALRLADFESTIIAEILQTTRSERNALLDCIDRFEQKAQTTSMRTDSQRIAALLDDANGTRVPYTLQALRARATERSSRSTESVDYVGLGSKLQLLMHSGAFDHAGIAGLDPATMLKPGRVNVIDVSVANDMVKNLVTANLIRKSFAWKISRPDTAPALIVVEEAHSFMSREKVQTMQATLHMLRNVTRRGRKHWLSLAFVSQQPGHLPPEIFELCNTRLVHTLRSMHNLDALMATTSDVTGELWAQCPLLGTGEAILSTPQLRRSVVVSMRPAASRRRFTR
jgi:DNA helicase HerA-like ATPase